MLIPLFYGHVGGPEHPLVMNREVFISSFNKYGMNPKQSYCCEQQSLCPLVSKTGNGYKTIH